MAWFFGNKQQKYIDNLEKNNKKHQEKEKSLPLVKQLQNNKRNELLKL